MSSLFGFFILLYVDFCMPLVGPKFLKFYTIGRVTSMKAIQAPVIIYLNGWILIVDREVHLLPAYAWKECHFWNSIHRLSYARKPTVV